MSDFIAKYHAIHTFTIQRGFFKTFLIFLHGFLLHNFGSLTNFKSFLGSHVSPPMAFWIFLSTFWHPYNIFTYSLHNTRPPFHKQTLQKWYQTKFNIINFEKYHTYVWIQGFLSHNFPTSYRNIKPMCVVFPHIFRPIIVCKDITRKWLHRLNWLSHNIKRFGMVYNGWSVNKVTHY